MKHLRPLLLLVGLLFTNVGVGSCGRQPLESANGGIAGTVACDDGTGATDCCLDTSAGTCSTEGLTCWSRCSFPSADSTDGMRGQKFCGGGQWLAGHGVFPCSRATSASDGGSAATVACNDGTGATDCCPGTSTVGACSAEGFSCWTRCNFQSADSSDGYRGQEFCSGGEWRAGKGLFPCSRGVSDGGSDSSTRCTPGADQTCNDNPAVSALWGHRQSTGVCACNLGTSVNPMTGRCRI